MPKTTRGDTPLQRAVLILGSQEKLAVAIGNLRSQSALSRMASGEAPIPPAVAKAIEVATDYRVRRWELLPDIWDAPIAGGRAEAESRSRSAK